MHHDFGSLHATYRTIDVMEGRVRSIRDWDGREWAQENGRVWPDDEWYKKNPQALVWPEQNPERDEVKPDNSVINWRAAKDPNLRWLRYQVAQGRALRKPCGQMPNEQPSAYERPPERLVRTSTSPRPRAAGASG
jgi:hypothetical protein